MSEKHVDNNVKQATKGLVEVSAMGNLYSKEEEPEEHPSQKEALPNEENRANPSSTSPTSLTTDQDSFLNFYEKTSESNDPNVSQSEKVILNKFLNEVRNAKPTPLKNWSALQHYIYYIYRNAIIDKPCNSNEMFPNAISKKIRELLESLMQEDFTQLCMRLVTLVREYAIVARGHFSNLQHPKLVVYIVSLMSYYSALCSAASKLAPLVPEFDFLIMERFNVNWLCLNKSIFYHYIYLCPAVQAKLPLFEKLRDDPKNAHRNLAESYTCFTEDMTLICARWNGLKLRISHLCQQRALSNPEKYLLSDWKMFEEQKKILKSNCWMVRSTQAMQLQDMAELDGHVISIVGDTTYIAEFLIDNQGHCMCEDCLAAEFRTGTISAYQSESSPSPRLITCNICQDAIVLDALAGHIATKHYDSPNQKSARVYLTPHQKRIPKKPSKINESGKGFVFEGLFENKLELKESLLKLVNGHPVIPPRPPGISAKEREALEKATKTNCAEMNEHTKQNLRKLYTEQGSTSMETEVLKHKQPSSRVSEASCPIKPPAFPIFQAPTDSAFSTTKDPVFKIASEAPIMQNGNEMMFKGASNSYEETESYKMTFDEFLTLKRLNEAANTQTNKSASNDTLKRKSTEANTKKAAETSMKATELFANKDAPKTTEAEAGKKQNFISLASANAYVNNTSTENSSFRKPQQKAINNADQKMLEFLKNANSQKSSSGGSGKPNDNNACSGHACGHKCKQDDDKPAEMKKHSCQDTCEHHKESRKCDCAYCEVFGGASIPPHTHKTNETRDRLRTRLNQRKEKVGEGITKGIPKTSFLNSKLASKGNNLNCTIKITGSSKISVLSGKNVNVSTSGNTKVNIKPSGETDSREPPRVPELVNHVPPASNSKPVLMSVESKRASPLLNGHTPNLSNQKPPFERMAPLGAEKIEGETQLRSSLSLSNSSLNSENVDSRDINELLNYIEGNKTIDKAALAQKKAAKKARQRVKKAQEKERIETEKRLKEEARLKEEKRKEEERLKAEALAKQLAEKEKKLKKAQEEKVQQQKQESKKNKKKVKNDNVIVTKDTERRPKSNLIEETIPAMVTIKRISEGSDSPATVTITLKGSTPESDKILLKLVNGHNKEKPAAAATTDKTNKVKKDPVVKIQSQNKTVKSDDNHKNSKKNKKKKETVSEVSAKELKVTAAADKNGKKTKANTNSSNTTVNTSTANISANAHISSNFNANSHVGSNFNANSHVGSNFNANSHISTNFNVNPHISTNFNANPHISTNFNANPHISTNFNTSKKNVRINETPKVPEPRVAKGPKENEAKVFQPRPPPFNNVPKENINLPMLRLPPGITITKIEAPPTNRNYKVSTNTNSHSSTPHIHNSNVPVSKSGVIVVDTEKLIQQSITANNNKKDKKKNRKNKREQKLNDSEYDKTFNEKGFSKDPGSSSMVTLKNPIFHNNNVQSDTANNKTTENTDTSVFSNNQQASIFKNENGMVTIRSPRLQNSFEAGAPISNFLTDLKPSFGPDVSPPYVPMCHSNFPESNKNSSFDAQEILSGLPGIEITKVDKTVPKNESESKSSEPAEVSIIPTSNGANAADRFHFDRDDWPFESVFAPRDVLEDDLDADEIELEAFKRFCQQSVPPERKEKVVHLNVKDIILNKKRDVTYS